MLLVFLAAFSSNIRILWDIWLFLKKLYCVFLQVTLIWIISNSKQGPKEWMPLLPHWFQQVGGTNNRDRMEKKYETSSLLNIIEKIKERQSDVRDIFEGLFCLFSEVFLKVQKIQEKTVRKTSSKATKTGWYCFIRKELFSIDEVLGSLDLF